MDKLQFLVLILYNVYTAVQIVVFALFVFMLVLLCFCIAAVFRWKKDLYINMATEFNKETDSAVSEIVFFWQIRSYTTFLNASILARPVYLFTYSAGLQWRSG